MNVKHDYIPEQDEKLLEWADNVITQVAVNAERWKTPSPTDQMHNLHNSFGVLLKNCQSPNHGKIDTLKKNEMRRKLEKEFRDFVQGFLARNPYVSDIDRQNLQITVRDTRHTTVPVPEGKAEADIQFISRAQLQLIIKHVPGSPVDARAEHGYRIYHGVYHADEVQPASGKDLRESMFTRHKKVLFDFQPEDVGKMAYFCVRFENSKGQAGPWGQMVSTLIP